MQELCIDIPTYIKAIKSSLLYIDSYFYVYAMQPVFHPGFIINTQCLLISTLHHGHSCHDYHDTPNSLFDIHLNTSQWTLHDPS